MDAAREVAQLVERRCDLALGLSSRARASGSSPSSPLEQPQLQRQGDEPLLGAVVQVALEPLALLLPGLDDPGAGAAAAPRDGRAARPAGGAFSSAMPAAAPTASSSSGSSSSAGSCSSAAMRDAVAIDQRRAARRTAPAARPAGPRGRRSCRTRAASRRASATDRAARARARPAGRPAPGPRAARSAGRRRAERASRASSSPIRNAIGAMPSTTKRDALDRDERRPLERAEEEQHGDHDQPERRRSRSAA